MLNLLSISSRPHNPFASPYKIVPIANGMVATIGQAKDLAFNAYSDSLKGATRLITTIIPRLLWGFPAIIAGTHILYILEKNCLRESIITLADILTLPADSLSSLIPRCSSGLRTSLFHPIIEELWWRGCIQTAIGIGQQTLIKTLPRQLKNNCIVDTLTSKSFRIVFTSILFGLAHFNHDWNEIMLSHVISASISSIWIYSFLREETHGLWAPIAAHIANNSLAQLKAHMQS